MTSLTVLASITASAAVAVLLRPSPMTLLGRLRVGGLAPHARQARAAGSNLRHVVPRGALLGGVGCGVAVVVQSPAPALVALVAGVVLLRRSRLRAERAAALNRRHAMIELCAALSAELRAGRTPREALIRAASGSASVADLCSAAVTAAHVGGDVPASLHAAASIDGAKGLRWLATCWQVAEEQGAGLAAGAERLAEASRAEEALRQEVAAQLAGPRATALLLAVLPGVGVLLGTGLGASPLDVLLRTPWGFACLVLGALLAIAGVAWTERLARTAEEAG